MPPYCIFIREGEVSNPQAMADYQAANRASPPNPKFKPLAIYGKLDTLEGEPADGVIILEFPTMADAREWYGSPEYQAAAVHHRNAANYRVLLVEGLPAK